MIIITLSDDESDLLDSLPPFSPSSFHSYSDYNPSFDSISDSFLFYFFSGQCSGTRRGGESRPVLPLGVITGLGEGNFYTFEGDQTQYQEQTWLPQVSSRGCNLL